LQNVNVKIAKHHPSQWSLYKVPPLFVPFLCCDVIADKAHSEGFLETSETPLKPPLLPPVVIWDRKTLSPELTNGEIPGTIYGLSDNRFVFSKLLDAIYVLKQYNGWL